MECMHMEARALKSSLCSEIAMKTTNPQIVMDDYWCVTGLQNEDFSIDEFFDLPNEDNNNNINVVDEEEEEEKDSCSFSLSSSQEHSLNNFDEIYSNSNFAHFETDLAIPDDDVQELELWSHLMDDSISEPTLACPNPILDPYKRQKIGFNFMNRVDPVYRPGFFRVPVKPRTKRGRTTVSRSWISGSTESPSCSSSSSSPVSTLFFPYTFYETGRVKPAMKTKKRKQSISSSLGGENPITVQRRCSHCQVTKTPQWRAGPNGPKTLCNACGVRFKSGRLFPEYRPACSPTFSSEIHSNSHRKVLEMRKKKEGNETICGSPLMTVLSS